MCMHVVLWYWLWSPGIRWLKIGWWWFLRCTDTKESATSPTSLWYQVPSSSSSSITTTRSWSWRSASAWTEIQWLRTPMPPGHFGWEVFLDCIIALCLLRGTDSYLDFSCHSCSGTPMWKPSLCSGLSWRAPATTHLMSWTVWWRGGVTRSVEDRSQMNMSIPV